MTLLDPPVGAVNLDDMPGSPGWWLGRLLDRLALQAARAQELDDYFRGNQPVPVLSPNVREALRRLLAITRTNFAELIVQAVLERMMPVGFRTGAVTDPTGDAEAWRVWQANSLDADCHLVHQAQLAMGSAYVIVGGVDQAIGAPLITPEDPRQVTAELDPIRRRNVRAALKVFRDDLYEMDRAYLYLPGEVWTAHRYDTASTIGAPPSADAVVLSRSGWVWDEDAPSQLPIDVGPVVPFLNRADMFSAPVGEYEPHTALLDRINYTVLNRLEIATLQAFRQRAVKGVPVVDESGSEIDYSNIFAADPGALWLLPETAELWESGQVDLGPIRSSVGDDVEYLAAVTRTPMHYFRPSEANQSAEGAAAAREALVFKAQHRIGQATESWEQVMSLAFALAGDEARASRGDMEVLWADPQRFTLGEKTNAAVQAQAAGVPWRTIMSSILQYSPQEIDRMEAERAADALVAAMAAPLAAPAANASTGLVGPSGGMMATQAMPGPEMMTEGEA